MSLEPPVAIFTSTLKQIHYRERSEVNSKELTKLREGEVEKQGEKERDQGSSVL